MKVDDAIRALQDFPWRNTGRTLLQRFREDRLGNTASSLTFTTLISLVPLFAVVLAVFSAFPMFGKLQVSLQQWLAANLIPDVIAKQVIGALTQFASKASRLGWVGFAVLLVTAVSLVLTIDRTFNAIWRVRRPRPLAQRVLIYWGVLTLGPLVLAGSIALTSYVASISRDLVEAMPDSLQLLLDLVEFSLSVLGAAALYHYVPHTAVRWRHALVGGLFVALGLDIAKRLLVLYIKAVPTFSAVYGAFSAVPILLLWIYLMWVVVLLGAVVAAYLPTLLGGIGWRADTPGSAFQLSLEVLRQLDAARRAGRPATGQVDALAKRLWVESLQLEAVLETLADLGWVGRLEDGGYALLVDPAEVPLQPLVQALLLGPGHATAFVWQRGLLPGMRLQEALGTVPAQG
jgi:membrane protein